MKELLINGGIIFVSAALQIFIHTFILDLVFNIKLIKTQKAIYTISLALYTTIFKLCIPISFYFINPIFYISISALILLIICKTPFWKGVLYSMFLLVLSIPFEIIGGTIAANILHLADDTDNVIVSLPILAFIIIGEALVTITLYIFKNLKKIQFQFDEKYIGINIIWAFSFLIPNIIFYTMNRYNYPLLLLIYNILANIALVVLSIYNTYKYIKLETTERDLQNSEMHNKSLISLVDSIRIFKHDYNNVIQAIGGYIKTNDMTGLEKYYKNLSNDSNKVKQLESISPKVITEPSIYGIIASKYEIAQTKHINFNFESIFNYTDLDMPIFDFCKILGILIDNAIEAAEESNEKEINIKINQSKKTLVQHFLIENTYLDKNIDIERIFEKDYSTKNRNSGLGLWEVKNIVDKNKNVKLVTTKDDIYFRQELYIQINEK